MLGGVSMKRLLTNQINKIKNPTLGHYIIETIRDKNVNTVFTHSDNGTYSPLYKLVNKCDDIDIVFNNYEYIAGYNAIEYSKSANTLGVVINTSSYGFVNLYKPLRKAKFNMHPILMLSLYDSKNELTTSGFPGEMKSFIKESITIKNTKNFSTYVEDLLDYSFTYPAGPVHLRISNELLKEELDFNIPTKDDDQSLLQYFEEKYNMLEEEDSKSLPKKLPDTPAVSSSKQLCKMYEQNALKRRKNT